MIDPALGPFPIADTAPVLRLGRDLDRQASAGIDPGHLMIAGRSAAHIDAVGLDADEAWKWKPAAGTGREFSRRLRRARQGGDNAGSTDNARAAPARSRRMEEGNLGHCATPPHSITTAVARALCLDRCIW